MFANVSTVMRENRPIFILTCSGIGGSAVSLSIEYQAYGTNPEPSEDAFHVKQAAHILNLHTNIELIM